MGGTLQTAAPLSGNSSGGLVTVDQGGVIETRTDQDVFSLASGGGLLEITVSPGLRSPNLDISVDLLDAAGTVIASSNPLDALNATLSVNVAAGGYFLKIDGVGKGDPAVDGYSDYASVGRYVISGSYPSANGNAPVAIASATPTSGYVPLDVSFSSSGSSDADGVIVAYSWDFGDGTHSTEANPLKTYNTPGTYMALLTVTDSQGLTGSTSLTIEAQQDPLALSLHVGNIALSSETIARGRKTYYECVANVTVADYAGGPVSGAAVSGDWTGVTTSGNVGATTDGSGVATFTSPRTQARGTCTFSVNDVSLSGWTYDASRNLETTDSLTY